MTLQPITPKQQHILQLLYTYRFLTRPQVQQFMGHSDKRRVQSWLQDLRSKGYIAWQYDTSYNERSKPAVYYLDINGIRWFRAQGTYVENDLRTRYRDKFRTSAYMETCRLVADTALNMRAAQSPEHFVWATPADYTVWQGPFSALIELRPTLFFVRSTQTETGNREAPYLMELSRRSSTPFLVRQRLKAYVRYLMLEDWRESLSVCPTVLFVCPDATILRSIKRTARRQLGDHVQTMPIRFTTLDQIVTKGFSAGIWESAAPLGRRSA